MLAKLKLVFAGALLALLPLLLALGPSPQGIEAGKQEDPFHEVARWNFAKLQYTNAKGEIVDIGAATITKIWVVHAGQGQLFLEIYYENGDYSMIRPQNFHLIARSPGAPSFDVTIVRTGLHGMAFPKIAKK